MYVFILFLWLFSRGIRLLEHNKIHEDIDINLIEIFTIFFMSHSDNLDKISNKLRNAVKKVTYICKAQYKGTYLCFKLIGSLHLNSLTHLFA